MAHSTASHRFPRLFRAYLTAVVLAAAVALALLRPAGPLAWPALAVALILLTASEASAVSRSEGGLVSLGGALDVACVLLLGPVPAAWLSLVATVVSQGVVRRQPLSRVAHDMAAFSLTVLATGFAFLGLGGQVGRLELPRDLVPLLACGVVFFLCRASAFSMSIGLSAGPDPWRVWRRTLRGHLAHHLSFLAFGAAAALLYLKTGPWGLALLVVPALLAGRAFRHYVELRADLRGFVRALSEVIEEVDPYTRQHSARVARYAGQLARELGRPEGEVEEIECAALVHDLGKIGPQNQHILRKQGTLSREEQRTLREHPVVGAEIVGRIRALRRAALVVRLHHERPDGRGYPLGLASEGVPLGARILNVADAFDAMTSDRPHRRALTVEAALGELMRGAGTQFDARVVRSLVHLHQQGRLERIPSPSSEELAALRIWPRRAHG